MTSQNELDRILGRWFHGDATTAPPAEPLVRAIEATRQVRPHGALVARIGSAWTDADTTGIAGASLRPTLVVALVALLALALAGGALLVGGRVPSNPFTPAPLGRWQNGAIVFAKHGDIVVADQLGGDLRPLVTGPEDDAFPIFSPDGTKLAFTRDGSGLMLADADGTNIIQVTPDTLGESAWRFSPDGRSLVGTAVIDGEPDGPACELGNAPRRVLIRPIDPAAALTVLDVPLWDNGMEASESGGPAFSPTNPDEILVVTQLEACGPRGIHVYDRATGEIRTILEPAGYVHDVAWTPDGLSITYDLTDDTSVQARVVAADGTGDRPLLEGPGANRYHRVSGWSNDSRRTVIAPQPDELQHVVISTSGDEGPVELACGGSTSIRCPRFWTWSPDDSMIIGPGDHSLIRADPDTGMVTELDLDIDLNDPQQWQRVAP